jgi:hypothetical protein
MAVKWLPGTVDNCGIMFNAPQPRRKRRGRAPIKLRKARRATGGVQAVATRIKKFIPNADLPFAQMAESFAKHIASDPERFRVSNEESELLTRRVREFSEALLLASQADNRTTCTIVAKKAARKRAEELVRGHANLIRADGSISHKDKVALRITERPTKLGKRKCPISPPVLRYLYGIDAIGAKPGIHALEFRELNTQGTSMKPAGAARLDLYFDLVPPGDPRGIPEHPAERGWPKFLRSFTSTPLEVEFPVCRSGPMLVVYWARWADAKGNTGPFSETCVARVEGWTAPALPAGPAARRRGGPVLEAQGVEAKYIFIVPPRELTGSVEGEGENAAAALTALGKRLLEAAPGMAMPRLLKAG